MWRSMCAVLNENYNKADVGCFPLNPRGCRRHLSHARPLCFQRALPFIHRMDFSPSYPTPTRCDSYIAHSAYMTLNRVCVTRTLTALFLSSGPLPLDPSRPLLTPAAADIPCLLLDELGICPAG